MELVYKKFIRPMSAGEEKHLLILLPMLEHGIGMYWPHSHNKYSIVAIKIMYPTNLSVDAACAGIATFVT